MAEHQSLDMELNHPLPVLLEDTVLHLRLEGRERNLQLVDTAPPLK
mgnify:CR=1 FL=1